MDGKVMKPVLVTCCQYTRWQKIKYPTRVTTLKACEQRRPPRHHSAAFMQRQAIHGRGQARVPQQPPTARMLQTHPQIRAALPPAQHSQFACRGKAYGRVRGVQSSSLAASSTEPACSCWQPA
eukprot:352507-Chlamydomonas_euryale.AAC.16